MPGVPWTQSGMSSSFRGAIERLEVRVVEVPDLERVGASKERTLQRPDLTATYQTLDDPPHAPALQPEPPIRPHQGGATGRRRSPEWPDAQRLAEIEPPLTTARNRRTGVCEAATARAARLAELRKEVRRTD